MFQNIHTHYIQPLRAFNRDTRLFLWVTIISGIIFSGWQLFFNIYMLQSGFTREFLGIVNSLPALTSLIFGLPVGQFSDRVGRKNALIIGVTFSSLAYFGEVIFKQPALIALMSALSGIFFMLIIVSISPLMMKLSDANNRTLLFSLNFGLQTIAGAVGSLFAGQLPGLFANLLHVGATDAVAYRAVLIVTLLIGTTALIPLWMMHEPETTQTQPEAGSRQTGIRSGLTRLTFKLALPNFLIGIGAAILSLALSGIMPSAALPVLGASGAVLGVGVAFAMLWPDAELLIFPLPMPIKARTFVLVLIGLDLVLSQLTPGDGVAHVAHIGGAAFGYLFFRLQALSHRSPQPPPRAVERVVMVQSGGAEPDRRTPPVPIRPRRRADADPVAAEVDRVLDKISEQGINSLTAAERRFLDEVSRQKKQEH